MSKTSTKIDPLEAKKNELVQFIFPWLKERGYVEVAGQIEITIRIKKRAYDYKLTEEDWSVILSDKWAWSPKELEFLQKLKDSNNELVVVPHSEVTAPYIFEQRVRVHLLNDGGPYSLSSRRRYEVGDQVLFARISKTLMPKKKERRTNG